MPARRHSFCGGRDGNYIMGVRDDAELHNVAVLKGKSFFMVIKCLKSYAFPQQELSILTDSFESLEPWHPPLSLLLKPRPPTQNTIG